MNPVIVCPNSGFANRLKNLVSASLFTEDYRVYWPPEDFCGLGFADIFADSFRETDHIAPGSIVLNTWRFELPAELKNLLPAGFSDCSSGYKGIVFPGDDQARTIDFEYLKIPQPILEALKKQFSRLSFSEEIMGRVNAIMSEMPEHYVGVHARTWFDEPDRTRNWFNFNDFVTACSRFGDRELFVTSDNPEFIDDLSRALNKKLITMKGFGRRVPKPWYQNSRDEMLDDIAELLVLSKASRLVLTAMSTYSEVAWYFGGCTKEVYFADPGFRLKGHIDSGQQPASSVDVTRGKDDVSWIEVSGAPSYHLALIPGRHVHLDSLDKGIHRIGDYVEKYSGYMKGSAANDYMIDIGANLGLSAFPVAARQRRVVAFEPVADNIEAMKKTIARNRFDNVTLVECAVSSQVGETYIYVPLGRADNTSFGKEVANANVSSPEVHRFLVQTETIDNWFADHSKEFSPGDARLLKIDVQGYETAVFAGAKDFLAACQPFEKLLIEFEFDPKLANMAGYSMLSLLELIHSYGMEVYYNGTQIPRNYYADFCSRDISCDLIALFRPRKSSEPDSDLSIHERTHNAGTINMEDSLYGQDFYSGQIVGSLQSAQIYLYHLFSIWGVPDSVVDVGCGRGAWLATCRDLGVKRVVGIDGYWNSQQAMIDQQIDFYPANLEQKFPITDSFDLAISLEVAEHLQPESSDNFIESLSSLSETVLFGAAFTGQPGVNHINTRPHSFWAGKFFERGYVLFDIFRPVFWSDDRVEPCYRQNTFLYVKPGQQLYRVLIDKGYLPDRNARLIDCIHPAVYLGLLDEYLKIRQPANSAPPLILPDHINVPPARESVISDEQTEIDSLIKLAESQLAANEPDKAADSYRQALAQRPNNPECLLRLAHVLLRMKCFEESFHYARQFLRMASDVPIGHYLAGHAARELGRWQESRTFLHRAVELDPSNVYARVLSCMSVFTLCMSPAEAHAALHSYADELDALICSTALDSAEQIDNAAEGIGALTPFFLPYFGTDVKSLQVKYGSWICSVMAAKYPHFTLPLPQLTSDGRIKIAIVSNYFHNHSNWKIPIKGWLEQLDRRLFSIHCFHTGEVTDTDTESARSLADSFLQSSDIEIVATTIREQQFDVLIYPGIGMDPATLKLAALRLAPVQCASWGHPVTTGMPTIDYYISSDLMEPPDGDSHYSEKLLRMPNLSIWYDQAATEDVDFSKLEIPALKKSDFLFLCCQNLLKYLPQYDLVFPTIAASVENARFVFVASPVSELTERFIKRLDLVFKRHGLNAADYVSMLPQLDGAEFAALNARADVFLDSIEWSGCNTVFESLPFNKPIVTLPGTFMRGRHAYAVLKMMGVDETVAGNVEEYVSIAIRLAKEAQWRNDIAAKMSSRKHLVYQDMECIAGLEQFLTAVSGRVKP